MTAGESVFVDPYPLSSWSEVIEAADYLTSRGWLFRGQERTDWSLLTSLEREFAQGRNDVEVQILTHFIRSAPRLLASHLVPSDDDVFAWLGLIQHYGGPTRLVDMTRSPYIGLFFAFEASGGHDRALWAIDSAWSIKECAQIMCRKEGISLEDGMRRVSNAQGPLVYSLVNRRPHPSPLFRTFQPFKGIFAVDPWKPDSRQSAQQAMFLCTADVDEPFMENIAWHNRPQGGDVLYKFLLPGSLRDEVIERLAIMNVTAATLFPDLGGLARSLRTKTIRVPGFGKLAPPREYARPPWIERLVRERHVRNES